MLTINLDVIRLTLHIIAATVWVGGMVVLGAIALPLRQVAPEALAPVTRTFARIVWPAFAVLVATGVWNIVAAGPQDSAYQATLGIKMVLVLLSGIGLALHTFVKNPRLKGVWGGLALLGALGAVLLGVAIAEAP
jgi:putative copper export protein